MCKNGVHPGIVYNPKTENSSNAHKVRIDLTNHSTLTQWNITAS